MSNDYVLKEDVEIIAIPNQHENDILHYWRKYKANLQKCGIDYLHTHTYTEIRFFN